VFLNKILAKSLPNDTNQQ